eukprot:6833571-Pyramimonas_sp.AAC.1
MPSTTLLGELDGEVKCDLIFYNQGHNLFHIIDRCIRFGAGLEIPDKSMTSTSDAYDQCWMQFGPATVLYSEWEGALNSDTSKRSPEGRRR